MAVCNASLLARARSLIDRQGAAGKIADDAEADLAHCSANVGDLVQASEMYLRVLHRTKEKHVEVLSRRWAYIYIYILLVDVSGFGEK